MVYEQNAPSCEPLRSTEHSIEWQIMGTNKLVTQEGKGEKYQYNF